MNKNFYNEIKNILNIAKNKVYQSANFAMIEAYWNIGKSIIEEQGGKKKDTHCVTLNENKLKVLI